jgi:hypothetical protein
MNRAIAAVQNGNGDPRFGTPGHTWDELAAVITNLPPLLSLMSRILRGLLGLKGPAYKLIRHVPPCAVLGALSLISEEHHNISPGSVSALWGKWYKITYVHGSDVSACIKQIRGDAERINCDGRSLQPTAVRTASCLSRGRSG